MAGSKREFQPLLNYGLHRMSWRELIALCVEPFAHSRTRSRILEGLAQVCKQLNACQTNMQMWIDGSFLTQKPDPEDSDVVVRISSEDLETCLPEHKNLIRDIVNADNRSRYLCDFYAFVDYAKDHTLAAQGKEKREYWMRQFGTARDGTPKGMAQLDIPVEIE
jgi:hypothetical protein